MVPEERIGEVSAQYVVDRALRLYPDTFLGFHDDNPVARTAQKIANVYRRHRAQRIIKNRTAQYGQDTAEISN